MPNLKKYQGFVIKSKLNGLVLDVEGANEDPGAKVITYHSNGQKNQKWYLDDKGYIRSRINGFAMDDGGESIVLNPFDKHNSSQKWKISGDNIYNSKIEKALDIAEGNEDECATVIAWELHGNTNQQWEIVPDERRDFFIVSEMHGKVMDIAGKNEDEGAEVVMYHKKESPEDNQLWYEDAWGNIRSKLNGFHLCTQSGKLTTSNKTAKEHGNCWIFQGKSIVDSQDPGTVLDIAHCDEDDCAKIVPYSFHGKSNQQWRKEYV